MCYKEESTLLLRGLIGDFTEPYTYKDERLFDLFLFGARLVVQEITFTPQYSVSLNKVSITPTPEDDSAIVVLGALKSAYIIANSEYKLAISSSVYIMDGPSSIDLSSQALALKDRVKRLYDDYEKAKMQFALGDVSSFGAILTPTTYPGNPIIENYYRRYY